MLSKRVDAIILVGSKFLSSVTDTSENDYILEAAKKDASKKAEGAIRKSAPAKMTPAADDDDDETETPEVVGGQVEDILFA